MGKKDPPREDLATIVVIAYYDPIQLNPAPKNNPWYKEGKIIWSDKHIARGFKDGFCVQYKIKGYRWHRVKNDDQSMSRVINYLKMKKFDYPGVHHINVYGGVSGKFKRQVQIPNWDK